MNLLSIKIKEISNFLENGRLDEAEVKIIEYLKNSPHTAEVLLLYGTIKAIKKKYIEAANLLESAIKLSPKIAAAHNNLGNVYVELKEYEKAIQSYFQAIKISPLYSEAHYNRARALGFCKRHLDAIKSYRKAIEINNYYVDAYINLGGQYFITKQFDDAKKCFEKVLNINNKSPEAFNGLGNINYELGEIIEAINNYDKAIYLKSDYSEAYFAKGNALHKLKEFIAAEDSYSKAIAINPNFEEAHTNLGNVLRDQKKYGLAVQSYTNAISINLQSYEAYTNYAVVLHDQGKLEEAITNYDIAIKIKPDHSDAYINKGNTLLGQRKYDLAIENYLLGIKLNSASTEAYLNLGNAFYEKKEILESINCFNKSIAINAENKQAYFNKSMAELLLGNYEEGWKLYEYRWLANESMAKREFKKPIWLGEENLKGKSIFIHTEQGLGDTIQFCRYIDELKNSGAKIIMEAPKQLINLMLSLGNIDILIESGSDLPEFDYHCPLLTLPLAFKTTIESIPKEAQFRLDYLEIGKKWSGIVPIKNKPTVGVVWSGSTDHKGDKLRSISLQELNLTLPEKFEYICLQKELREIDKKLINDTKIKYYGNNIDDFTDTAYLCNYVDLVISVDTSVAHLAASLGKLTWVLLPEVPDWRWLLNREDSPWYKNIRLFRQIDDKSWATVLQKIQIELIHHFN